MLGWADETSNLFELPAVWGDVPRVRVPCWRCQMDRVKVFLIDDKGSDLVALHFRRPRFVCPACGAWYWWRFSDQVLGRCSLRKQKKYSALVERAKEVFKDE
jgi:hypothetical protein